VKRKESREERKRKEKRKLASVNLLGLSKSSQFNSQKRANSSLHRLIDSDSLLIIAIFAEKRES
jgi:hypothetical protein